MLSEDRSNRRVLWVESTPAIQSKLPGDAVVPWLLSELRPASTARSRPWRRAEVPQTQVYVHGVARAAEEGAPRVNMRRVWDVLAGELLRHRS